jgi:hypothetical protein
MFGLSAIDVLCTALLIGVSCGFVAILWDKAKDWP